VRIVADSALQGRRNMICGANKDDYHLRNVTPGEDFQPEFQDLRQVAPGDTSADTSDPLEITKCVEIGHIFKLGYKYSEALGLKVTNEAGEEVTPIMGSYGIGLERILSAAIELYHDQDGIALPAAIAPFDVVVTPVNMRDAVQRDASEQLYGECKAAGLDAILDDRDERPGVKFKDNDLTGIPFRITVGKKAAGGIVEVAQRRPKQTSDVALAQAVEFIRSRVHA